MGETKITTAKTARRTAGCGIWPRLMMIDRSRIWNAVIGLATVGILFPLTSSDARSQQWKTFTMPVRHGLVVRYRYPPSWSVELDATGGSSVALRPSQRQLVLFRVGVDGPSQAWIKKSASDKDRAISLFVEEQKEKIQGSSFKSDYRVHRSGAARIAGHPAFFREVTLREKGENAPPQNTTWFLLYRARYAVRVEFDANRPGLYRRWIKDAEKMAASIRIVPVTDLKANESVLVSFRSKRVRLSLRQRYYLDGRVWFLHERPWKPVVKQFQHANAANERGWMVVEFLAPPSQPKSAYRSRIVIALTGLPVQPLPLSAFLQTTPALIRKWFGEPVEISQKKITIAGLIPLANKRTRRGDKTTFTYVRAYRVKAPGGGQLMIKAYTVGGMTAAANIFLVADKESYERYLAVADGWARAATVRVYSSAFRWGPR